MPAKIAPNCGSRDHGRHTSRSPLATRDIALRASVEGLILVITARANIVTQQSKVYHGHAFRSGSEQLQQLLIGSGIHGAAAGTTHC